MIEKYSGIHKATETELIALWRLVHRLEGKDLQALYTWATERSDMNMAANPEFVIRTMKAKLDRGA